MNLIYKPIFAFLIFGLVACSTPQKNTEDIQTPAQAEKETTDRLQEEHQLYRPGYADSVNQGLIADDNFKGSARRIASATIGDTRVEVNYGSPGKRGRVLWNGLVSYDHVWVTGSHWATALSFSSDVEIGGLAVPAGMYGFFTIPGRETWTLIVNKVYDQHLADDYDQSQDITRVEVHPEILDEVVQRLTYEVVAESETSGHIIMAWDQIKVALPFSVKQ